jgi:hypothetical protein
MIQTLQFLQSQEEDGDCPTDIRLILDLNRVVAAGFSFGAATVAQALATTMTDGVQPLFCAALLLDGWFHIDVAESAGIEFQFPEEAFQKFGKTGLPVPSLFIHSQQFQNYSKLFAATQQLAGGEDKQHTVIVIPDTGHQNFCEGIFWIRTWMLKKVMGNALGKAQPHETYRKIIQISSDFLMTAVKQTNFDDRETSQE